MWPPISIVEKDQLGMESLALKLPVIKTTKEQDHLGRNISKHDQTSGMHEHYDS